MTTEDRRIAEALKQRLLAHKGPLVEMRVFGSREIQRTIDQDAWEVGFEHGRVIMTFECTEQELAAFPLNSAPLMEDVRREGIPV